MKIPFTLFIAALLILSCAEKRKMVSLPPPVEESTPIAGCGDTNATAVFVNIKSVELWVSISEKTSVRQGNTIINNWKSAKTFTLAVGDSTSILLRSGQQFMYTIYGPVSSNSAGQGAVAESKFTLLPCENRRILLYN